MAEARAATGLRDAWHNRALRRLLVAYLGAAVSEWAVWLAVLVDAQERSGSAAAGWMALALLVPSVVAAPFAGRAFGGTRPVRVLGVVYTVQAVTLAIAAAVTASGGPLLAAAIPAAVATGGISFVRPGQAVLAPTVVRTARELTAANLVVGYCESGCVLLAPLIGTAVLALGGPAALLACCAGLAVLGVVATASLRSSEEAALADVHDASTAADGAGSGADGAATGRSGSWRSLVGGLRHQPRVGVLLALLSLQHLVMGAIGLMFVVLATDELGMGASGAGVLNIAFGVGAVLSGLGATVLAGRGRLAPVAVTCVGAMAASAVVLGSITEVPTALVCLALLGFARSLLDVSARMLVQRTVSPQLLSATFAVIEVITAVGLFVGTVYSQVVAATIGAPGGLVVMGLALVVALALIGPRVWQADRGADVPVVAVALLRRMPVFAPLPAPALEAVARAARERSFAPGEVLIHQGDPGESFHAIAGGRVDVDVDGRHVRSVGRGDGVGEIALLLDTPRTASVVAAELTHTFEIARDPFLTAVTGHEPSLHTAHRRIASMEF